MTSMENMHTYVVYKGVEDSLMYCIYPTIIDSP